jgi:Ca-activated chloride channel family protein
MQYASPQLIPVGCLAAGAAVGLLAYGWFRRRRALRQLANAEVGSSGPTLMVSRGKRWLKTILWLTAIGLLGFAVVGPQWGEIIEDAPQTSPPGRDVMIVLDVSLSMLAEDVAPSRLGRARADARDLAAMLEKRGGCRIGLIAFAGSARVICPLTSDYRCFEEELSRLTPERFRSRADTSGDAGTQIGMALNRVGSALDRDLTLYTDVILISDGGDMEEDTLAAADQLAKLGVPVHTIGLGSTTEGALIPITDANGQRTYKKYQGDLVKVKLEEDVLKQIAQRTGGQYLAVGTGFVELDRWFESVLAGKTGRELKTTGQSRHFLHRFQWFVLPALILLFLDLFVTDGRRSGGVQSGPGRYFVWLRRRSATKARQNVTSSA